MKKAIVCMAGILIIGMSTSCEKAKMNKEQEELEQYLLANDINTDPTSSGIYYIEIEEGNGPQASGGDQVVVKYTGTFLDGEEFDSGKFTFILGIGYVIPGWDEGIKYMKAGGKAKLIIPSSMGYGSEGSGPTVPGYSTLLFDVELIDIL